MQTHDPRNLAPAAFCLGFSALSICAGEYQRLAARGRMERAYAIHAVNERIRASNASIRALRTAEAADADLAELDAELGLV